jgi:hypothetical protein
MDCFVALPLAMTTVGKIDVITCFSLKVAPLALEAALKANWYETICAGTDWFWKAGIHDAR